MKWKKKPLSRRFLMGAKSAVSILVMLALLITLNVGMGHLPSSLTEWDLTGDNLYDLDEQTKQIVSSLETDVTLTLLAPKDGENEILKRLLSRYAELSSHVTVETLDPSNDTVFLSQYGIDLNTLYTNSVLVAAENDHQLVSYDAIYATQTETNENGEMVENATFLGEGALTNAIYAVTNPYTPTVYVVSGHGEQPLSQSLQNTLVKERFALKSLSLLSLSAMPDDADAVFIHAPQSDIAESEKDLLCAYLDRGGKVILITDFTDPLAIPNLSALTRYMGMQLQQGLVVEGDSTHHMNGYPYRLLPTMVSHKITQPLKDAGYRVLLSLGQAIERTEDTQASVHSLLCTSGKAYIKKDGLNTLTLDREEGDESHLFAVGAVSTLEEGQLLWVPSGQLLDDYVDQTVAGGNHAFFANALSYLCGKGDSLTIRSKSVSQEVLSVPARVQGTVTVTLIVGLPLLILAAGALVVILRKRR